MIKNCLNCDKKYEGEKRSKFCSRSCSATTNNQKRRPDRPCPNDHCNNQLRSDGGKFCSNKCKEEQKLNQWLAGENVGTAWNLIPKVIKEHIYSIKGKQCWQCGWNKTNPKSGNIPVEIDHIDGDSTNNRKVNLRLLCPNCHSLTETYKHLNKIGRKRKKQ